MNEKGHEITFSGYVTANEWVEDNVDSIAISTDDDDYLILSNGMEEELMDHLDEEILVTGLVGRDKDGSKWVRVISYEVLEDDEYEEGHYDGYEDYDDDDDDDERPLEF